MQKPKGTKDIYGSNANLHNLTTNLLEEIVKLFNFSKIETPIFEFKDVFSKTVGQTSEIVSKEMFEFTDKSQRNLVLRPEGTASIMRAVAENKMYAKSLPLKLYYLGPMFRYENPQKGRQRQFTQFGVEIIGAKSPFLDAEVILCATTILKSLGLKYKLKINSLADLKTRKEWFKALTLYFSKFENQLSKTSIKRIKENPMRILDDKVDGKKDFVLSSPKINQFYSQDTKNYFQTLLSFLKVMDIKYEVDYNLVRGLDYYTDTTFEFLPVDSSTSSQSTFIGGGRYDNLLSQFGGPNLSGVGFAIGLERLISNLPPEIVSQSENNDQLSVFVLNLDDQVTKAALAIVYMLRQANIKTDWNFQPTKISKAFDKGAKLGAQIFIIVGPKDIVNNQVVVKFQSKQKLVKIDDLVQYTTSLMKESDEKTNNGELRLQDIGKTITLYGFVANKRKMGSILFVDLRDSWGITQVVVSKDLKVTLTKESVIEVTGIVSKRKEKNPALLTGDIEVVATKITVLSLANQLPFIIHDKLEAHDETRFLHRFLDLRRPVMQKRFFLRHKINTWIREFLTSQKFLEIETPYLSKATPEGARDFLVPTRKKNKFFALPQSPQLYKQLLMASGFEKYFQIVRAFRDEDTRKDRQPEFTQLDIECAYAEPQDIKNLVEKLFQYLWTKLNFKVKIPFATMTYKHALDTYGTDKPDLRYNLELVNSRSLGPNLPFQVFAKETIIKHIFLQQTLTSSQIKELVEITQKNKKPDFLWASCLKDKKLEGSAVKVFPEELKNIFQKLNFQLGTLLFCVGSANAVNQSLGAIRVKLNQMFSLAKEEFNFVWIEDWPLFEEDTTNKIITPLHHLFTAPRSNDLHLLDQNPLKVKSEAYDLVLNGCEIGGGSKRINSRILQEKMFQLAGLSSKEVKTQFGFFLKAFNFGFPPHAGIAFGLDRLLMLLTNAKSIREVIAFPKNVKGYGVLEETPSTILE